MTSVDESLRCAEPLAFAILASVAGLAFLLGIGLARVRRLLHRRTLEALKPSCHFEHVSAALQHMSNGLLVIDGSGRIGLLNDRLQEMFGLPPGEVAVGMPWQMFVRTAGRRLGWDDARVGRVIVNHVKWMGLSEVTHVEHNYDDGSVLSIRCRPLAGGGAILTYDDVTEQRKAQRRVTHLAFHDPLTGLPNRARLREHMDTLLTRVRRGDGVAVLCLDLDGFKGVNDTLGHPAGDELLRQVARRLRDTTRDTDLVVRLGGDEFAVIQEGADQPVDAVALADRLVEVLGIPFDLRGQRVVIGTSVGIALADGEASTADELLRAADVALYRAKAEGRGTWRFFSASMDAEIQMRRALESDLRRAVAEKQFEVHYQPLVEAGTEVLTGFEALLRWRHPDRGLVSPGEFIPLAEEIGLIQPLGVWTLVRACADAVTWPSHVKVAVNLSPAQFSKGDIVSDVEQALTASGLNPERLELEITESILLRDSEATFEILHRLRDLGVRIAMDDFGTGYSSLSYLRSFPFDKIKVDQSFVRDLLGNQSSIEIVRAVVSLGKALGMSVLAEGVETAEQLSVLRSEGCDELQGFLFSRPRPVQDVPAMMADRPTPRACYRVGDDGDAERLGMVVTSHGGCNSGCIPPCAECAFTNRTVFDGGHVVAAKLEGVSNPSACGKEALRVTG
ncbi:putative bifunctional diguanylate cyclase/phosphodiesterase [Roseomonas sp. GCM10028921]